MSESIAITPNRGDVLDLSALVQGVHYGAGYPSCRPVKALRALAGFLNCLPGGVHEFTVEFTTHSNTNPAKVRCLGCFHEHAEVQSAHAARKRTQS